ncbi:ribosome biogenesis/translation initiation ATPase RLI [Candidatus Woesearchaeota archaeon]|nr:ribosome biogenesis/translation initiation ATPase RLI [Candidatus Woesearchaeota archaeon]
MKRIAVVDNNKLKEIEKKKRAVNLCPVNRSGGECIKILDDGKLYIDEVTCIGCGICTKVDPDAIHIVNLPEELTKEPIHRYSANGFALYNLPTPVFGKVVGIIGRNGIGKSTAVKILAGVEAPNLGKPGTKAAHEDIIEYFKGSEAQGFFEKQKAGQVKVSYKPQQVESIPKQFKGKVEDLLKKVDEKGQLGEVAEALELTAVLDHDISKISGGELQRVAIAACVLKDANVYFFDEPTSYLDVKQRLKVSQFIRSLATPDTGVVVIEHDLIILDYLADLIHLMYGQAGVYGVVSQPKSGKAGINTYLSGFLKDENVRFRDHAIKFEIHPPIDEKKIHELTRWSSFKEKLGSFEISAKEGVIFKNDIVGILGENGIGKTSFVRILAGEIKEIKGHELAGLKVAYKPQYLETSDELVLTFIQDAIQKFEVQLVRPLDLKGLFMKKLSELSGGELQRVHIAKALSQESDVVLMDEPSAYLDVEQRLRLGRIIKDTLSLSHKSALIVDHDLLFVDTISERLIVFEGKPAVKGEVEGPFFMEAGMNRFLKNIALTFRRDEETKRPRINKPGSQLDTEQKRSGRLYYA